MLPAVLLVTTLAKAVRWAESLIIEYCNMRNLNALFICNGEPKIVLMQLAVVPILALYFEVCDRQRLVGAIQVIHT